MEYIRYEFEGERFWMELDDERYAIRGVIVQPGGAVLVSCRDDCLAEGVVYDDESFFSGDFAFSRVAKDEFEELWRRHTAPHREAWERARDGYPVGTRVEGIVRYFYPQGTIFSIGEVQGVADYDECRANGRAADLAPGHGIAGVVAGYDETNMWLRLAEAVVGDKPPPASAEEAAEPGEYGPVDIARCVGWYCVALGWSGVLFFLPLCLVTETSPWDFGGAPFLFWMFLVQIGTAWLVLRRVIDGKRDGREEIGLLVPEESKPWKDGLRIYIAYRVILVLSFVALRRLTVGALFATGYPAIGSGWVLAGMALSWVIGAPVMEEIVFRGVMQTALAKRFSLPVAVFATTLAFALLHDEAVVGVFFLGLALAIMRLRCGSLYCPMVFHALHNLVIVVGAVYREWR